MLKNQKTNNIEKSTLSENLLDTRGDAKYLNLNQKQLQNYRGHKRGPKYTKINHICFYNIHDLDEWKLSKKNIKTLIFIGNPEDKKTMEDKTTAKTKVKFRTDAIIPTRINQMKDLIDSKKGFLVNKTYVAIFKNIILMLSSLDKEIEVLKKKVK